MKRQENCLICGKENTRTYYTGDSGLEEEYYYCPECGYFRQMAYSPMTEGITDVEGKTFEEALRTRTFEPDAPNFTPRISGIMHIENGTYNYAMSILKSNNGNPDACNRYTFAYENPVAGEGHFIHTYKCDGNPLPSFEGEPKTLELPDMDIDSLTDLIWKNLNEDNKVSLFVRQIPLDGSEATEIIINKNK